MKKVLLGLALLLGTVASAATCTPIKESKSYTTHDDGTGPYMSFQVFGTYYSQESTITTTNSTLQMGPMQFNGYVDVYAGFNGCTIPWNITGYQYYYQLYDLTVGQYVYTSPTQSPLRNISCGVTPACSFSPLAGIPVASVSLTHGHSYHYWCYLAFTTTVGSTYQYFGDWVKIVVN